MTSANEWEPKGQLEVYAPAGYEIKTDSEGNSYSVGTWAWKYVSSMVCEGRRYTILTVEADSNYRKYQTDAPRFRVATKS